MLLPDIKIPTLLLDETVCRENIARMRQKADAKGIRFRPHFKTHQSRRIASWFREEGVRSITVSSVGMARYFADAGWNDITIAFPVNLRETAEIDALASKISLGILVESASAAASLHHALTSPVDTWIKIDAGYHRSGVSYDDDDTLKAIARAIDSAPMLGLRGILTHAGDTYQAAGPTEVKQRFSLSRERMLQAAEVLRSSYPELIISVGDTPGCTVSDDFSGIDEMRPGNFVFYDVMQLHRGICRAEDVAVALACPIVSLQDARNEIVVYGGAVHLSREYIADSRGTQIFGLVARMDDESWGTPIAGAFVTRMSQEHGVVHLPAEHRSSLREGDLLAILPVHSCLTAECMRQYRCLDGTIADHFAAAHPQRTASVTLHNTEDSAQ